MTLPSAAVESIYSRFVTLWSPQNVEFTFDNEAFEPPASESWVRVSIRHTESLQETLGGIGNRRFRRRASVFIQLFTPVDVGTTSARLLAKSAADIFEGVSFGGLDFDNVETRELGPNGSDYVIVVEAFFAYEERK